MKNIGDQEDVCRSKSSLPGSSSVHYIKRVLRVPLGYRVNRKYELQIAERLFIGWRVPFFIQPVLRFDDNNSQ
jgi:hypothetical protein